MTLHQWLMIAVMAAVVIFLRAFPFLLLSGRKKTPALLFYLGRVLTAAAIAMLVVYSIFSVIDYNVSGWDRFPAALLAGIVTAGLQYVCRNPLVSIICGTAVFMLLR
ncbi:MAG: AzlD domain-containing protein [Lentisphaeria bacterium]|nr:AzlD domain-containing protein [Lentisphaeria bacterium]